MADAIERGATEDLREELGDLLLQVVFHARMAEEAGLFDFGGVVEAITAKLIRRHPHVFGDISGLSQDEVNALWERIKAEERAARASRRGEAVAMRRTLDGVPSALPALSRALKLQDKAGKVGFDWNDPRQVLAKIREEADEVEETIDGTDGAARGEEIGDLLFSVANLARHLGLDPEAALRDTNAKFARRFAYLERRAADEGIPMAEAGLERLEVYWNEIRAADKLPDDADPAA